MQRTCAGLAGLVVFTVLLLAACGQTASSVKQAVSSIAASVTATRTAATSQPTTDQPTTAAPTTAAPTTTAPTTAAPTTAAPTTTAPTTAAPTATATTPAAGTGSGFPWAWFWVALGIAAVAGLVIWAIVAHRRRASAATGWRTRVIDAYAKGSALHDAMAAAETPGALAAADSGLRWADIQRRADDYSQLLYRMQQEAPSDQQRILVADVIAALQAARSAMDSERSAGQADGMLAGIVRDRISFFASSLNSLREPDVRPA